MDSSAPSASKPATPRQFGRFELRQLLGKSVATMAWLAFDPRTRGEVMLVMPRRPPVGPSSIAKWQAGMQRGARLNHPNLAPLLDIGVQEQWPYVVVDRRIGVTLGEWMAEHPEPALADTVNLLISALQGLAYAHDAGTGHQDVQLHSVLVNDDGEAVWMALGAAGDSMTQAPVPRGGGAEQSSPAALQQIHRQRGEAQRDLLGCGLLMHRLLAGALALDEPDFNLALARLAPTGREILRLPYQTPQAIPDALRAIANRCTAHLERHRYRSARTLLRALEGWRQAQALESGGPLALLMDRLQSVGHLPAQPGLAARVTGITSVEGQHAEEIAEQVLQDIALSLELVRSSNSVQVRGSMEAGGGPILAIRRSIALLGVDGVRRAANSLRLWPGPLRPEQAEVMQRLFDRVRLAGYAGQALRPAGYDAEVVFLIVVLQNLGRLLVHYHFPEEAEQIEQLMQPGVAAATTGGAEPVPLPGMAENVAANAVLGVDFDALRSAVVRHWGLGEDVVKMIRPLSLDKGVRAANSDVDTLRATASAASELAQASDLEPPQRRSAALSHIAARYSRVLKISVKDLRATLQNASWAVQSGGSVAPTNHTPDTTMHADLLDGGSAPSETARP